MSQTFQFTTPFAIYILPACGLQCRVMSYQIFTRSRTNDITAFTKRQKFFLSCCVIKLQRRHNGHDGVPNHQLYDCLLNCLFRWGADIEKTSKLRVTGLCEGNSPVTGEFPAQRASNTENVSIWWHHHEFCWCEVSEAHPRQCQTFFAIS